MIGEATLIYDLIILLIATLMVSKNPWQFRLIYILLAAQVSSPLLVKVTSAAIHLEISAEKIYATSELIMAWLATAATVAYARIDAEKYPTLKTIGLKYYNGWKIAVAAWLMSGIAFAKSPIKLEYHAAEVMFLVNAFALTAMRSDLNNHPLLTNNRRSTSQPLIMALFAVTSFAAALRVIYQSSLPEPFISQTDQVLSIFMPVLGLYLPLTAWQAAYDNLRSQESSIAQRMQDQLEGVGYLIAQQPEYSGASALGLVVTDKNLSIRYTNKTARDLMEDGGNLLRGVSFCKVFAGLSSITPANLDAKQYVFIEPINAAKRSLVELKSVQLPQAFQTHMRAYSLRRVIADQRVLEYAIEELHKRDKKPWWIIDNNGYIFHRVGAEAIPRTISKLLEQHGNLITMLQQHSRGEASHGQMLDAINLDQEHSVRIVNTELTYDHQIYFYPIHVGRADVRRLMVTIEPVPKAPPLKGHSKVHYWKAENLKI